MNRLFDKFKLNTEKEDLETVVSSIEAGITFRGTNLWILIFAIFVASLGLNVNSTAVIIGAMLISSLMGPIMGIGLGMGINDIRLLKKSISNYLIATIVALATSTLFFLISPLHEAHSEILARTSPTIYDVLIALFGGFAGVMAISSKYKGNVIPGVAIATALMPPLCTAGYGLATLQFRFFYGAFYLFIINTVFIALATLVIVRVLHLTYKNRQSGKTMRAEQRVVWLVVLATLLPSIYLGYDLVQQRRFIKKANQFINTEAHFPNDYLLSKTIDPEHDKITLIFGGQEILPEDIQNLKSRMKGYGLDSSRLILKQGFSYLIENGNEGKEQFKQLTAALNEKERQTASLRVQLDSINSSRTLNQQVSNELKAQYTQVKQAIIQSLPVLNDSLNKQPTYIALISVNQAISKKDRDKILNWLRIRLNQQNINLLFTR